jgi:hypothetical protein
MTISVKKADYPACNPVPYKQKKAASQKPAAFSLSTISVLQ